MSKPALRLRLLTLNTQLMYVPGLHSKEGVVQAARRLGDSLETDRWADVLCLNEVFDEDCRAHLVTKLTPIWPHVAKQFGPKRTLGPGDGMKTAAALAAWLTTHRPDSALGVLAVNSLADHLLAAMNLPEDSGLMVFSRYPIIDSAFESYADGASFDWLADKGVAHVAIERSVSCEAHIFLSHMQASYDTAEQHDDERAKQLAQAAAFIARRAPSDGAPRRPIIVFCGDFNVHGGPGIRPEWERTFIQGQPDAFYSTDVRDAWDHFISPPDGRVTDPGITNYGDGRASRLDYVLLRRDDAAGPRAIVVQRMELAQEGVSDHIGLHAEINIRSEHCFPADARPITSGVGNVSSLLDEGGLYWLYFGTGGTWSFLPSDPTEFRVVPTRDVSHEMGMRRVTDLSRIPHAIDARRIEGTPSQARTYEIPGDFLVMIRRRDDETGPVALGWYRHLGTSPDDPLLLSPQRPPKGPDFAALEKANAGHVMEFWFEGQLLETRYHDPLDWRFLLHNPTGEPLDLTVSDATSGRAMGHVGDTMPITELAVSSDTRRTVRASLRLSNPAQRDFGLQLRSPLTFLVENRNPFRLFCVDETGVDWMGSDEIALTMRPDSQGGEIQLLDPTTGVNTGRDIPISSQKNGNWTSHSTAFRHHLEVTITEAETLADDKHTVLVPALPDADEAAERTVTLEPGAGEYRLTIQLAREPG